MTQQDNGYTQGDPVRVAGTYRCSGCGELWTTDQTGVRFPPCNANKEGGSVWTLVDAGDAGDR